jgi:hypothetical protein
MVSRVIKVRSLAMVCVRTFWLFRRELSVDRGMKTPTNKHPIINFFLRLTAQYASFYLVQVNGSGFKPFGATS